MGKKHGKLAALVTQNSGRTLREYKEIVARHDVAQCLTSIVGKFAPDSCIDAALVGASAHELDLQASIPQMTDLPQRYEDIASWGHMLKLKHLDAGASVIKD